MVREYTPTEAFEAGGVAYRSGFVTRTKSITGHGGAELERILGYRRGVLDEGWWFLQLDEEVEPDDFEFAAYTNTYHEVARHEVFPVHETMEERYSVHALDRAWWNDRRLATAVDLGRARGAGRTAKVVPARPHGAGDFTHGRGVPQFRFVALKKFRVVLSVPAGARVVAASPTDPTSFKVVP